MIQLQEISSKIAQLIEERPDKAILGVHLGYMLRRTFPTFSPAAYQCRNLRQFIRENVPQVREAGYSGADVRYELISTGNPQISLPIPQAPAAPPTDLFNLPDKTALPINVYLWKAYSNPSHPFHIAVNQDTGEVRTVPSDSTLPAPWLIVPKPTAEFLREIAREFVTNLTEPLKSKLMQLLLDPKWYINFSAEARKHGVITQWAAFRRKRLIAKYNETLLALNMKEVPSSQRWDRAKLPTELADGGDEKFRSVLLRILEELPTSELRLLRLPVGIVFDALRK